MSLKNNFLANIICTIWICIVCPHSVAQPLRPVDTAPHSQPIKNQQEMKAKLHEAIELLDSWRGDGALLDQAKEDLDDVISYDPKNASAYREYARYYLSTGYINGMQFTPESLKAAEDSIKKSLALNPKFAEAYVLYGHLYYLMGNHEEAISALETAEKLGTTDPWLQNNWAEVLLSEKKYDQALAKYEKVSASGTKNKKALIAAFEGQIACYTVRGQFSKVDAIYKKMVRLEPNNAWVYGNYSTFLRTSLGKYDDAISTARKALSIMNYGVGESTLAYALYAKYADVVVTHGKPTAEAQIFFDEATKLYPNLDYAMAYAGSFNNSKPIVQMLMSKHVSIDARADDGSTALIIASNTGRAGAVKMLLSLGARTDVQSDVGWTPLLGSADEGYLDVVKMLLQAGANPWQKLSDEEDAADRANRHGYTEIAKLVREYQAKTKRK